VKRCLLLLLLAGTACSAPAPYVTTVGVLKPGTTLAVQLTAATLNAYQPAQGQPRNLFTVSATALPKSTPPPAPQLRPAPVGVAVLAPNALQSLLVRVPDRVNLVVDSQRGDVNVTDIAGNARVVARQGNVTLMLPGYAQVAAGTGNITVTMGAVEWPGTLRFSTRRGDITLRVSAKAAFRVRLHTDDGTLFTDFGLRGNSQGNSETIEGDVSGGGGHGIDVTAGAGAIRLLRLVPQP
jgi:hypothetical protein